MTELHRSPLKYWDRLEEEVVEERKKTTTFETPPRKSLIGRLFIVLLVVAAIAAGSYFAWNAYYDDLSSVQGGNSPGIDLFKSRR